MTWNRQDQEFFRNDKIVAAFRAGGWQAIFVFQELYLTAGRSGASDEGPAGGCLLSPGKSTPEYLALLLANVGIDVDAVRGAFDALSGAGLIGAARVRIEIRGYDEEWRPPMSSKERQRAFRERQRERATGSNDLSVTVTPPPSPNRNDTAVTPHEADGCPPAGDVTPRDRKTEEGRSTDLPLVTPAVDDAAAAPKRARGAAAGTVTDRLVALTGAPAEIHVWLANAGLMAKAAHARLDLSFDLVDGGWSPGALAWSLERLTRSVAVNPKQELVGVITDPKRRAKAKRLFDLCQAEHARAPHHFPLLTTEWKAEAADLAGAEEGLRGAWYDWLVAKRYYSVVRGQDLIDETTCWSLDRVPDRWRALITHDGELCEPTDVVSPTEG